MRKLALGQKKAHLMEVQVNGGTVAQKVDFAYSMFEKVRPRPALPPDPALCLASCAVDARGFWELGRHSSRRKGCLPPCARAHFRLGLLCPY